MRKCIKDGASPNGVFSAGVTGSLDVLVANAKAARKLTFCNSNITSGNFPETGACGELVSLTGRRLWRGGICVVSAQQVIDALDGLGYRPGTMLELASYAGNGWDGKTAVSALGSVWRDPAGASWFGYLWFDSTSYLRGAGGEWLDLADASVGWYSDSHYLAARK